MLNSLKIALLLAVLLSIAAGTARAQADEPEDMPQAEEESFDEEPEFSDILEAIHRLTKDFRLTEADVQSFVKLASKFDTIGQDNDLEERLNKAVLAGKPFEDVILADAGFKKWTAEHGVDGKRWLQTFFRIQMIFAREEMTSEDGDEMEKFLEEELADLEENRTDLGEELYAEMKADLMSELAEHRKQTKVWMDFTPEATEEEQALLTKYEAEISRARGSDGFEDVPADEVVPEEMVPDEPFDEEDMDEPDEWEEEDPFEDEEGYVQQLKKLIDAVADFTKETRLDEAGVALFIKHARDFDEMSDGREVAKLIENAVAEGKPFADIILANEKFKAWTAANGLDGPTWLKTYLRVQLLMGRGQALEQAEMTRESFEMERKELEERRAEIGEEAYEEELLWLTQSREEEALYLKLWESVAAPPEAESKVLAAHRKAIQKAMGMPGHDEFEDTDDHDGHDHGDD